MVKDFITIINSYFITMIKFIIVIIVVFVIFETGIITLGIQRISFIIFFTIIIIFIYFIRTKKSMFFYLSFMMWQHFWTFLVNYLFDIIITIAIHYFSY